MKQRLFNSLMVRLMVLAMGLSFTANAQFVHPGGLHTKADLDRMKAKVAANGHPWIDGWNKLIADGKAQNTWVAQPYANIGGSPARQRGSLDAHAAYMNALRWYVSGDVSYAECAVRILNAWSSAVNQVASGELFQLPINNMMQAAEVLRAYSGWKAADIAKFKNMALTYFYPGCHDFLGSCFKPSSWDSPAAASIMGIAVFCDDTLKFKEAVTYYKSGVGNGSLLNTVWQANGQIAEMGRDQPHASLGPAALAEMAQTAWNQGDTSLYSYSNNRLLAGFEFFCKYNLNHPVPWVKWDNCIYDNLTFNSPNGAYRIGQSPVYEMLYNHYVVSKGLNSPYLKAMAALNRPEQGDDADFFGCGTLAYTIDAIASPYPPYPIPAAPTNLIATAGVSRVSLTWTAPDGDVANGYNVLRSTSSNGVYTVISTWKGSGTEYVDSNITNGTTYYYKVSAINQSGTSINSTVASATPMAATNNLPIGWATNDIGSVTSVGSGTYANNDFIATGTGAGLDGTPTSDGIRFIYANVTGNATITIRLYSTTTTSRQGVMVRETLAPGSKMAAITLGDKLGRLGQFTTRFETNATKSWANANQFSVTPIWYRIKRVGNVFTFYESGEGVSWTELGTSTISMNTNYLIGMFVGNGTAVFDHITVEGGGGIPIAPTNFTATALNSSRIKLTWTASAATSCYNLKRSMDINGPFSIVKTGITGTTYEDYGLIPDTTYYYVMKSANVAGESADSVQANAKTLILKIPPAPTGLKATGGNSKVTLSWTATEEWTSSYNIKRSKVAGGPYSTVGTSTTANYIDNTASNDTTYYYVVSSVNSLGEGPNSAEVNAKPLIGLFRYWPMDETSGTYIKCAYTGVNGTLITAGSTLVNGKYNNGVHLDGVSNAFISLPNGFVSSLKDFTISIWVKLDALDNWARIFDLGTGTTSYMFLSPKSGSGYLGYSITTSGNTLEQRINTTTVLPTGVWTHIAVTLSGTVGILYVNGNEVGRNNSMTLTPSNLGLTTQNYIGKSQWTDPYLKGSVDEFRIFSQALTKTQITTLKNALGQTIAFDSIPGKIIGDPDFTPGATASSGLPISYKSSNTGVASIISDNIHISGLGTANITALQTGNLNYVAALPVIRPLVVSQSTGIITINDKSIINVYPNPVSDFLHIQLDETISVNAVMYLYDSKGLLLQSDPILGNSKVMDVRRLSAGFYFLKITNGRKVVINKFVKI